MCVTLHLYTEEIQISIDKSLCFLQPRDQLMMVLGNWDNWLINQLLFPI